MNTYNISGGFFGHWTRRVIHLSLLIIPIIYYWGYLYFPSLIDPFRNQLVSAVVTIVLLFEFIRFKKKWMLFGQRFYETKQISSLAQTALSVGVVLLIAPKLGLQGAAIGTPLIWTLACIDPLMGEMRRHQISYYWLLNIALIAITLIWLVSVIVLQTPLLLLPFVIPLALLGEVKKIALIDDNALILFYPLIAIILLSPWLVH